MKIGLAQIKCSVGDVETNCSKITSYAERAARQGCETVIFPEMSDTGYVPLIIGETASSWADRPFSTVQDAAAKLGVYVICGMSVRVSGNMYIAIAIFSPE